MKDVIEFAKQISTNFKPRDKERIAENFPLYHLANPESYEVLVQNGIEIKKNSQVIVLTQEPKTLIQTLDLATKMNFKEAYQENPARLRYLVSDVIKRMAKCDAIGVPYKTDKGFANFLFSEKLFKEMTSSLTEEQKKIISTPTSDSKEESKTKEIDSDEEVTLRRAA